MSVPATDVIIQEKYGRGPLQQAATFNRIRGINGLKFGYKGSSQNLFQILR
jgi:hypothetical protein